MECCYYWREEMTIYIVMGYDFGAAHIVSVHDNIDSARVKFAKVDSENSYDWVTYGIEEWDVEK